MWGGFPEEGGQVGLGSWDPTRSPGMKGIVMQRVSDFESQTTNLDLNHQVIH